METFNSLQTTTSTVPTIQPSSSQSGLVSSAAFQAPQVSSMMHLQQFNLQQTLMLQQIALSQQAVSKAGQSPAEVAAARAAEITKQLEGVGAAEKKISEKSNSRSTSKSSSSSYSSSKSKSRSLSQSPIKRRRGRSRSLSPIRYRRDYYPSYRSREHYGYRGHNYRSYYRGSYDYPRYRYGRDYDYHYRRRSRSRGRRRSRTRSRSPRRERSRGKRRSLTLSPPKKRSYIESPKILKKESVPSPFKRDRSRSRYTPQRSLSREAISSHSVSIETSRMASEKKSTSRSRSVSPEKSLGRSRSLSRGNSVRSRSVSQERSFSRSRSRSASQENFVGRSRTGDAKPAGRTRSLSGDKSVGRSRSRSHSGKRSVGRSRSLSEEKSVERSRSMSMENSIGKGRSVSRERCMSRSKSMSQESSMSMSRSSSVSQERCTGQRSVSRERSMGQRSVSQERFMGKSRSVSQERSMGKSRSASREKSVDTLLGAKSDTLLGLRQEKKISSISGGWRVVSSSSPTGSLSSSLKNDRYHEVINEATAKKRDGTPVGEALYERNGEASASPGKKYASEAKDLEVGRSYSHGLSGRKQFRSSDVISGSNSKSDESIDDWRDDWKKVVKGQGFSSKGWEANRAEGKGEPKMLETQMPLPSSSLAVYANDDYLKQELMSASVCEYSTNLKQELPGLLSEGYGYMAGEPGESLKSVPSLEERTDVCDEYKKEGLIFEGPQPPANVAVEEKKQVLEERSDLDARLLDADGARELDLPILKRGFEDISATRDDEKSVEFWNNLVYKARSRDSKKNGAGSTKRERRKVKHKRHRKRHRYEISDEDSEGARKRHKKRHKRKSDHGHRERKKRRHKLKSRSSSVSTEGSSSSDGEIDLRSGSKRRKRGSRKHKASKRDVLHASPSSSSLD